MLPTWGIAIIGGFVGWYISEPLERRMGWVLAALVTVAIMLGVAVVNGLLGGLWEA